MLHFTWGHSLTKREWRIICDTHQRTKPQPLFAPCYWLFLSHIPRNGKCGETFSGGVLGGLCSAPAPCRTPVPAPQCGRAVLGALAHGNSTFCTHNEHLVTRRWEQQQQQKREGENEEKREKQEAVKSFACLLLLWLKTFFPSISASRETFFLM